MENTEARQLPGDIRHEHRKGESQGLQWIAAIESGIDPRIEEKNKTVPIGDFFADALKNKRLRNASDNTVERYQNVENNFLYWCDLNGLKRIDEITSKHLAQYFYDAATKPIVSNEKRKGVRAVRQNGASPKTLEFEKTYLKYVFQYAISEGLRTENPASGVVIKDKKGISMTKRDNPPLPLPKEGFARLPQILHALGIGKSAFWQGVKDGKYPQPVKLGPRTTVWKVEDIRELIRRVAGDAE